MVTIQSIELINNIDKYILLAEKEEIKVVENDKVLFYLTPQHLKNNHQ